MSAALDTHAWNRGSQDGSKKSRYAFAPAHREPRRAGPGPATLRAKPPDTITRPADPYRDRKKKRRPPLSPTLFRYASQLRAQRRIFTLTEGSKLHADEGSIFDAD